MLGSYHSDSYFDSIGPTPVIGDNLFIPRLLITSEKPLLLCVLGLPKITLRLDALLGGLTDLGI